MQIEQLDRYDIAAYGLEYGCHWESIQDTIGDWVKWEDIEALAKEDKEADNREVNLEKVGCYDIFDRDSGKWVDWDDVIKCRDNEEAFRVCSLVAK